MLWKFTSGANTGLFFEETDNNRVSSWKRQPRVDEREILGTGIIETNLLGYRGSRRRIKALVLNSTQLNALESSEGLQGTLTNTSTGETWDNVTLTEVDIEYVLRGIPARDGCWYHYQGSIEFVKSS